MAGKTRQLTAAEETLARVLADAVAEDLLSDHSALWIGASCADAADQLALARQLRAGGREVVLYARTRDLNL